MPTLASNSTRSFINIKKSNGPITLPCITPLNMGRNIENVLPICVQCDRPLRYSWNHANKFPLIP